MRTVDVLILLGCILIITLSFQNEWENGSGVSVEVSWAVPIDVRKFENGRFPTAEEMLALPVVTDLDGDGQNEVIVASTDNRITVYNGGQVTSTINFLLLPEPVIKSEASTVSTVGVSKGKRPIAMASGWIKQQNVGPQVLVVVTEDFTVLCYNHKLKLEWETSIKEHMASWHYLSEVTILVSPQPIRVDDVGAVIVGGKILRKHGVRVGHDHTEEDDDEEAYEDLDEAPWREANEEEDEEEGHFSYYAFDGKTGTNVWKHTANDFMAQGEVEGNHMKNHPDEMLSAGHSTKLHIFKNLMASRHTGQLDWREHRYSMMAQLPHVWRYSGDSRLALANFKKNRQSGRSVASPLTASTVSSSSNPNKVSKPNVVVSHTEYGLEAVHYYTGRTLCYLFMLQGTTADINGDGVIDRVTAVGTPDREDQFCVATVSTGNPPISNLWSTSICSSSAKGLLAKLYRRDVTHNNPNDGPIEALPPVVFPAYLTAQTTASFSLIRNLIGAIDSVYQYNSVFFISTGLLSCLSPTGTILWQLELDAGWDPRFNIDRETNIVHFPTLSLTDISGTPTILVLSKSIALVSPTGELLTEKPLLHSEDSDLALGYPIARPVIGDFNNDGTVDIIIQTSNAFYGYTIQTHISYRAVPVLGGALFLVLTYLAYRRKETVEVNAKEAKRH
eukprot:TRINITY_DN6850_c0_g1_i1.p1 TRINITY_DN6850_c0_g1~~TRINITY_DN6850_c0_g1_i1.p1  ORF type:complete len:673 (-),score=149.28 TRINITY_DN6850_c0_g1_i1:1307-3325(-)